MTTTPSARITLAAGAMALGFALPAGIAADFTLVSQDRSVEADAYAQDGQATDVDDESHSAQGFGLFDEGAGADVTAGGANANVGAWQESDVTPQRIVATGGGGASTWVSSEDGESDCGGSTEATVVFEITAPTMVRVHYRVSWYDSGWAEISLNGVFSDSGDGENEYERGFNVNLDPGTYTLEASADFAAFGDYHWSDYGSGDYHVDLLATTAGDANGDRDVNFLDLLEVLTAWGACDFYDDCYADMTGDQMVDFDDLLVVLGNFGS